MIYGDEKVRQMCRSILPSTARKKARREKRVIARSNRREVNLSLHQLTRDPESWDDGMLLPSDGWNDGSVLDGSVVSARRYADKLNHFEKWAAHRTRHLPKGTRLDAIRPILPNGLIGWHAETHLGFLDQFEKLEVACNSQQSERPDWVKQFSFRIPEKPPSWSRSSLIEQLQVVAADAGARAELNELLLERHKTAYLVRHSFSAAISEGCKVECVMTDYYGGIAYWQYAGPDGSLQWWKNKPIQRAIPRATKIGPLGPPQLATRSVASFVDRILFTNSTKDPARRHPEWLQAVKSFLINN